jgi:homoserine O-succinyltransferase
MIRLSVGIEHIDDILEDLDQALDARRPAPRELPELPSERRPSAAKVSQGRTPAAKPQITVALVNNMPDAALAAAERQFSARLEEAAGETLEVRLALYALPGIPRGDLARAAIRERYAWVDALEKTGADAVIVTGCEPRAQRLPEEPYWRDLVGLIDWARTNTHSALFSCLAAHAAVLHMDAIERRRGRAKTSGVFAFERLAAHPLTYGIDDPVLMPHSRHYGLWPEELASKGYQVLTRSAQVGADIFLREAPSLFVFLQGHPEYEADTLMHEYRRDFTRFFRGEQAAAPACPQGYFDPQTEHALQAFTLAARRGSVAEGVNSLYEITAGFRPAAVWRTHAVRLYSNWLQLIAAAAGRIQPDPIGLQRLRGAAE